VRWSRSYPDSLSSAGLKGTGWQGGRETNGLLFFSKKIAYPDHGIDLILRESRQQIPSNRGRMYRTSSIELFLPEWGQDDEDGLPVYTPSVNQRSFLHARQQV
jgi:hypothetical protein